MGQLQARTVERLRRLDASVLGRVRFAHPLLATAVLAVILMYAAVALAPSVLAGVIAGVGVLIWVGSVGALGWQSLRGRSKAPDPDS